MEKLYLTAILPEAELTEQIDEIRKDCAEKYEVKAALKPPVHITLFPPFKLNVEREEELLRILNPVSSHYDPFQVCLENFDTFNSHVVFIRVLKNPHLTNLHHELTDVYSKNNVCKQPKSNKGFHPHITIAYRDIPHATFPVMWSEYKNKKFKRVFTVGKFHVLRHDGQKWQPFQEYKLQKPEDLQLF